MIHDFAITEWFVEPSADSIFNDNDDSRRLQSVLTEISLDTRTGASTRRAVLPASAQVNLEVGMVNRNMHAGAEDAVRVPGRGPRCPSGFAKVDLATGDLVRFDYDYGYRHPLPPASRASVSGHAARGTPCGRTPWSTAAAPLLAGRSGSDPVAPAHPHRRGPAPRCCAQR